MKIPKLPEKPQKKDYINAIIEMQQTVVARLNQYNRVKTKKRMNRGFAKEMENLQRQYTYKTGKNRKGTLKTNIKNYSKPELKKEYEDFSRLLKKDIWSAQSKRYISERSENAYKTFIGVKEGNKKFNELSDVSRDDYRSKKLLENRKNYTRKQFDNLVELYNILGKKLVEEYGSTEIQSMYEESEFLDTKYVDLVEILEEAVKRGFNREEALDFIYDQIYALSEE